MATTTRSAPCAATSRAGECRVLERRRSDDDAAGSRIEGRRDDLLVRRPPATSTPTRSPTAATISRIDRRMRWRSIAGTVEIDDVKPASAGVGEPAGDGDGLSTRRLSRGRNRPVRRRTTRPPRRSIAGRISKPLVDRIVAMLSY